LSRNYALNYLRHKKVMAANEEAVMRDTQELQDQLDEYEQAMNRLKEKVEKLPAKQREVLDKYFIEGKTYKEIADELDISLNTVKTHLRRALKFLRDELQEEMILLLLLKKQPIEPQK
ncbi:MAG: sigma-70 family RNA polymerase sigma factor, partial [Odoribacter sp.]